MLKCHSHELQHELKETLELVGFSFKHLLLHETDIAKGTERDTDKIQMT